MWCAGSSRTLSTPVPKPITVSKNAPEEKFIKFYLQWDHNFWATRQEKMKNGKVSGPTFNSEKKYGTIRTVNGESF
ncbi:hypothetical protein [Fibrobacter sp.]|uniref:hypothetical protein n=1 Tax=Fibrobacter sp. TaxID=35828 RepID=UPI00388EDF88